MNTNKSVLLACLLFSLVPVVTSGVASCAAGAAYYATCQTACNTGYGTCL